MSTHSKILVVDDEESLRDMLVTVLEDEDYLVDSAENGVNALELLKSKKYDLLVTDLFMPKMNGFDLIRNCQLLYPETKIIMLCGGGDELEAEHGQKSVKFKNQHISVDLFMKKPWRLNEFLTKLEEILDC